MFRTTQMLGIRHLLLAFFFFSKIFLHFAVTGTLIFIIKHVWKLLDKMYK